MPLAHEFEVGLSLFGLSAKLDKDRLAVWELLAPHIEGIVDVILSRLVRRIPAYRTKIEDVRQEVAARICAGTRDQFVRPFDEQWLAAIQDRIQFELAHGFDLRSRPALNRTILSAFNQILKRRYRFSSAKALRLMDVATRALMHDASLAANLHWASCMREARRTGRELAKALDNFEGTTVDVRRSIFAGAETLRTTAEELRGVFESIGAEAERAAQASAATAANLGTAANATEDLSGAIVELEQDAAASASRAGEAVAQMARINATIAGLSQAVARIGSVVDVIAKVAEQTNLLALNATIEAARAGEAGRGFAVVAVEVKALATQTSQATVQIADLIKAVQESTACAVGESDSAGRQIDEVAAIAERLADAVNRQTAAAGEIAQAASGTSASAMQATTALGVVAQRLGQTRATSGSILDLSKSFEAKVQAIDTAIDALFATSRDQQAAASPLARIMADATVAD